VLGLELAFEAEVKIDLSSSEASESGGEEGVYKHIFIYYYIDSS